MREVVGDLFAYPCAAIVIPVNWTTKSNGEAVMGAGVAKEAARRWPWMPRHLGQHIRCQDGPPRLHIDRSALDYGGPEVFGFPTKLHWRDPSDLALIEAMARVLADYARGRFDAIALPRVGCGLGGLRWDDVRAVLAPILDDDCFVVVSGKDTTEIRPPSCRERGCRVTVIETISNQHTRYRHGDNEEAVLTIPWWRVGYVLVKTARRVLLENEPGDICPADLEEWVERAHAYEDGER